MNILKVGDKVVLKSKSAWKNNFYFRFDQVVRVTRTQAVLSNNIRLKIESSKGWNGEEVFAEIGESHTNWQLSTPEIEEEAKVEAKRQKINRWFDNQRFTDEQKAKIYEIFNQETNGTIERLHNNPTSNEPVLR